MPRIIDQSAQLVVFTIISQPIYHDRRCHMKSKAGDLRCIFGKSAQIAIFTRSGAILAVFSLATIGISVAYRRYQIAIVLSLINFLIFQFSKSMKKVKASDWEQTGG